ncbi:MAG TPA: glycosyltransferase [Thermoplasmata archaeon]|nr:glycosyltransferase [Thermoplasmata archaeon]
MPTRVTFVRPYPYGGGGSIALVRSLSRFSRLRGTVLTETPAVAFGSALGAVAPIETRVPTTSRPLLPLGMGRRLLAPDPLATSDVLDVAEVASPFSAQLVRAAKARRVPISITSLETVPHRLIDRLPPMLGRIRRIRSSPARFRVFTGRAEEYLRSVGVEPERIRRLPLGVDLDLFHPLEDGGRGPCRLLYARRLEAKNGLPELLRAVRRLPGFPRDVTLAVAGDGPLAPLARAAADHHGVEYLGRLSYDRLAEEYRRAWAFCNPARDTRFAGQLVQEDGQFTFPLLEAQASGVPIVTTESGANRELLADGNALVPQRDPDRLREALETVLDPSFRSLQGRRNRAFVEVNFDGAKCQRAADDYYEQLAVAGDR